VSEVLTCLRTAEEAQGMGTKIDIARSVDTILDELEQVQHATLKDISLRALIAGTEKT